MNYESFQNGWWKQILFLTCMNTTHYFPVIFSGDSFCCLGCFSSHTCAHQSSAKYMSGLFYRSLSSSLLSTLCLLVLQLPPSSPRCSVPSLQCRNTRLRLDSPFLLRCLETSQAGNTVSDRAFLPCFPSLKVTVPHPDIQCLEKHFPAFCSFPLEGKCSPCYSILAGHKFLNLCF